jgi:O-antigen/teichoic acid export membrane protein
MNSRSSAIRNTLFSSVGIYTEYLLGLLTSILIARHLGPQIFGGYSLIIWMVSVGVTMTNAGTANAVIKFVAECRGGNREELIQPLLAYLRRTQRMCLLLVLAVAALLSAFAGNRLAPGYDHLVLFGLLVVTISLRAPYMFNISLAKGFENFRATATISLIATPVNLAMVLAAWLMHAPAGGFLAVFAISSAVFFLASHRLTMHLAPPSPPGTQLPPELRRRIVRHMRFVAVTITIGFVAASDVEVLFLNLFASPAAAGEFKVAFQLAIGATLLLPGVLGALLLPMMANALSRGMSLAGRRFVAATTYLALLAAPLVAFGGVFAGAVIGLLVWARPMLPRCRYLLSVCLAARWVRWRRAHRVCLVSADRQRNILILVVVNGAIKLLLDFVLTVHYGLAGAVAACVTANIFTASAMVTMATRVSGLQPDWSRLLRIVFAALLAARGRTAVSRPVGTAAHPARRRHRAFTGVRTADLCARLLESWRHRTPAGSAPTFRGGKTAGGRDVAGVGWQARGQGRLNV